MAVLRALAPGKFNSCLFVGTPRADGLHPLVSVVQPLSLADELTLAPAPAAAREDEVVCPGVSGPNLALRALAAYRLESGWDDGPQRLTIDKRVPVAAGMGGGSADAAAALRLAAAAAGRSDDPRLTAIAPQLGSDVAAQLLARRCLVTGVGERVEPLPEIEDFAAIVVPSPHKLATPAVYAELDRAGEGRGDDELRELAALVREAGARGEPLPDELAVNDLEPAARRLCPSIASALSDARAAGAVTALVSGSGPTVVGLFAGADARGLARAAARGLRARHPGAVAAEPVTAAFASPYTA